MVDIKYLLKQQPCYHIFIQFVTTIQCFWTNTPRQISKNAHIIDMPFTCIPTFPEYELDNVWPIREKWRISSHRSNIHISLNCDVFGEWINRLSSGFCSRICRRNEPAPYSWHALPPREPLSLMLSRISGHKMSTENSSVFYAQIGCGVAGHL